MSFELKFFVCRHVSIWGFQNRVCLSVRPTVCPSVCPYPENRNNPGFINIRPTLVIIDTSMERSSRVLQHRNPKIWFFSSKKFKIEFWLVFWLVLKRWNHPSFVNISPTLGNYTPMVRSLRLLYHEKSNIWFY